MLIQKEECLFCPEILFKSVDFHHKYYIIKVYERDKCQNIPIGHNALQPLYSLKFGILNIRWLNFITAFANAISHQFH